MKAIQGYHHTSLTVTDLAASAEWYQRLFGLEHVLTEKHEGGYAYVFLQPETKLFFGLHEHEANDGKQFHESRTGLDHLCFSVTDRAELVEWEARLAELEITHSPIKDTQHGSVVVFRDPDDIQLELFAPPGS
jgi:catechol 2,3-dioxygenase-like lactoylglutathione lyase family enzyme